MADHDNSHYDFLDDADEERSIISVCPMLCAPKTGENQPDPIPNNQTRTQ